jgi:hypothetical protein
MPNKVEPESLLLQLDAEGERPPDHIDALLVAYESATPEERQRMRATGKPCDRQRWLNGYAYGKANVALQTRSERPLQLGLLALSLHEFACDFRDDYFVLAHLFYAADQIGSDRLALAARIGSLSSTAASQHMLGFAARPASARALSTWRLHEFQTADGPEVRSVPPGWTPDQPEPPRDWAVNAIKDLLRKFGDRKR